MVISYGLLPKDSVTVPKLAIVSSVSCWLGGPSDDFALVLDAERERLAFCLLSSFFTCFSKSFLFFSNLLASSFSSFNSLFSFSFSSLANFLRSLLAFPPPNSDQLGDRTIANSGYSSSSNIKLDRYLDKARGREIFLSSDMAGDA